MDKIRPDNYFRLVNGTYLKSIDDLKLELKKNCNNENLENFKCHVNANNNDYANWLSHVFKKEVLAKKIKNLKAPDEILQEVINDENGTKKETLTNNKVINDLSKKLINNILNKNLHQSINTYKEIKKVYNTYPNKKIDEKKILRNKLVYFYNQIKSLQEEIKNKPITQTITEIVERIKKHIDNKDFVNSVNEYRELKKIYMQVPNEKKQEKINLKKQLINLHGEIRKIKLESQQLEENKEIELVIKKIQENISNKDFMNSVKKYKELKNIYTQFPNEKKQEKLKIKKALFYYFDKIKSLQREIKEQIKKENLDVPDKDYNSLKKEVDKKIETPQEFLERIADSAERMSDKTKKMKKNSYIDFEKQKESTTSLREKYEELYAEISEHRKKGKDMFVPYMHLRLIKPKLQFLELSNNSDDRELIGRLLSSVEQDISDALDKFEPDLKKEVLIGAGVYEEKIKE